MFNPDNLDMDAPVFKSVLECLEFHEYDFPFAYMDINDSFLIEATKDNEVALIRGSLPYALNKFNKQNNSNIRITTRTVPDGIRVWRIA